MAEKVLTRRLWHELFFILLVIILSRLSEYLQPIIRRKIHAEEVWLYKNPQTPSFITSLNNIAICSLVPLAVFGFFYSLKKKLYDLIQACFGLAFSAGITGLVTNIIKNLVCRPRPDFFERCFPDGVYRDGMPNSCTGMVSDIIEGLKSFPSGHSSMAFSTLGFTTLYVAGKLHCFNQNGRSPWRLVVSFMPLLLAIFIAISRTADYHHHWQDVLVGAILGMLIAFMTYRQKYPSLGRSTSHIPYISSTQLVGQIQDAHDQRTTVSPPPRHIPTESSLKIV